MNNPMSYQPSDTISVPEEMDEKLLDYDVDSNIKGEIEFTVANKTSREVKLCIHKFTCESSKRV